MKYETSQNLIHTSGIILIFVVGLGVYALYKANERLDKLELSRSSATPCPKCPTEVNCHLKMDPIRGELLYKEKR